MSEKVIFSSPALVEIQGKKVLKFIRKHPDFVEFKVLGFNKHQVNIHDYRKIIKDRIMEFVEADEAPEFPEVYCQPAMIHGTETPNGDIRLDLEDTEESGEEYRLWIAVGMPKAMPIPKFGFLLRQEEDISEDEKAFISIYERPASPLV